MKYEKLFYIMAAIYAAPHVSYEIGCLLASAMVIMALLAGLTGK